MKNHEFTIIASGFGAVANYEDRLFKAGCDDATISIQKGLLILDFDRAAVTFSSAIGSAIKDVVEAGFQVERVEPDHLVSLSEIAERAGLSRQGVSLYAKGERKSGFPTPAVKVMSTTPLWDWCEVAQWLHREGLLPLEDFIQARIVKEANIAIATKEIAQDGFIRRLEMCAA